jgi:NADH dehydrogenase
VQISLGDLGQPASFRHAMRGVRTVVHLAAALRDQPGGSIEELNAVATWRMVQAARRAGVEHFVFFSAIGASTHAPARYLRAKALGERAVADSGLAHTVFAPSMVYAPGDPYMRLLRRLALLPAIPVPAPGRARFQPIWAQDVADCVLAALRDPPAERARHELAGPETLTTDDIVRTALRSFGRRTRRIAHVPPGVYRRALRGAELAAGPAVFATPDEIELALVSMTSRSGTADAERLGVRPRAMRAVLGVA